MCGVSLYCCFFFFKQKTAYEMRISDWSSDVCSSDLVDSTFHATCRSGPRTSMISLSQMLVVCSVLSKTSRPVALMMNLLVWPASDQPSGDGDVPSTSRIGAGSRPESRARSYPRYSTYSNRKSDV